MKVTRDQFEMRDDPIIHLPTGATFWKVPKTSCGVIGESPDKRYLEGTITAAKMWKKPRRKSC